MLTPDLNKTEWNLDTEFMQTALCFTIIHSL